MSEFICPVATCNKELSKLQVMHFRSAHNCDPVEWVQEQYGETIRTKYKQAWPQRAELLEVLTDE